MNSQQTYKLQILKGSLYSKDLTITPGETVVGRHPSNDICFAKGESSVSKKHAVITYDAEGVHIKDAGSTNGTYVNGSRVEELTIFAGDVIGFGDKGPQAKLVTLSETSGENERQGGETVNDDRFFLMKGPMIRVFSII